jgi:hypothetical protein
MSIHEQMGWVRYGEIQAEMRTRERERLLRRRSGDEGEPPRSGPSMRQRIGWRLIRVGARIAAVERS